MVQKTLSISERNKENWNDFKRFVNSEFTTDEFLQYLFKESGITERFIKDDILKREFELYKQNQNKMEEKIMTEDEVAQETAETTEPTDTVEEEVTPEIEPAEAEAEAETEVAEETVDEIVEAVKEE